MRETLFKFEGKSQIFKDPFSNFKISYGGSKCKSSNKSNSEYINITMSNVGLCSWMISQILCFIKTKTWILTVYNFDWEMRKILTMV